jgi:hypothetical protein
MRPSSLVAMLVALAFPASLLRGQTPGVRPLTAADLTRLSPSTRQTIAQLGDSLRAAGLPDEPLYAKAAEGVLKEASDARILTVVRTLARELGAARAALGTDVDDAELLAGASALHVGATPSMLRRLAAARSSAGPRHGSLATPLIALTDLLVRHVPPTAATTAIDSLVTRGAPSADFAALRAAVERDIASGRSPEASVAARTQSLLQNIESRHTAP